MFLNTVQEELTLMGVGWEQLMNHEIIQMKETPAFPAGLFQNNAFGNVSRCSVMDQ